MNQVNKLNQNAINNNQSQLQNSKSRDQHDFEFDDVEEYEEEFDELAKSDEKPIEPPSKQNNWNQGKKAGKQQQVRQSQINQSLLSVEGKQQSPNQFDDMNIESPAEQDNDQPEIIQNQQPQQQSFTLLSNKHQPQQQLVHKTEPNQQQPQLSKQELSQMIHENDKVIKQLKQKTTNYRQEIKNISNLVDKDIHKSIVKISNNKNSVNIKNVFSQILPHSDNPNIAKLREELVAVRNQSKQLKADITAIQDKLNDPISHQNALKCQQLQTKLKLLSVELNKAKEDKHFAALQLQRMKLGSGMAEFEHFQKSILRNEQILAKLSSQIKEERAKIYKLQKQDIFEMQKLKFLIENNHRLDTSLAQNQKSTSDKTPPEQLKKHIHQLLISINSALDQRNTIQNDKTKLIKSLNADIQAMEQKNLALLNQARTIDAFLLQFYTHKAHLKRSINKLPKTAQKLHQTIDAGSPILREKHNQTTQLSYFDHKNLNDKNQNDKNQNDKIFNDKNQNDKIFNDKNQNDKNMGISVSSSTNKFRSKVQIKKNPISQPQKSKFSAFIETQDLKEETPIKQESQKQKNNINPKEQTPSPQQKYTESKSVLSFGDLKVDQKGAILSDEILGKVKIKQIYFFVDKKNLYGVHCKYFNEEKPEIVGMKICEKNADEKCEKMSLVLNLEQQQQISAIKVGYSLKNQIKLIEITTSLQNSVKWSVQNQVSRTQTKSIQKYASICIKAKLISPEEIASTSKSLNELMIDRPKLKLAGLGFSVVQLVKSTVK